MMAEEGLRAGRGEAAQARAAAAGSQGRPELLLHLWLAGLRRGIPDASGLRNHLPRQAVDGPRTLRFSRAAAGPCATWVA